MIGIVDARRLLRGAALLVALLAMRPAGSIAQSAAEPPASPFRHAIDLSPMSPLFRIYAVHYSYRITRASEVIVGPYYANIHFDDIGHTNAPGFIVGYRRYLRGNLHIDYQLMPQWDHFYEENERKRYPLGFDLWNEFRLGYSWEIRAWAIPSYINVQWPFGFALYSDDSAKPESFKRHARDNPYFYFPPMFFVGVRF
jgi:hypothetical protein